MADIQAIAKQYTEFYYATFDQKNFSALQAVYRDTSMLTFEGAQILGAQAIVEKLGSLPFEKVVHKISTQDAQPAGPTMTSMVVLVTGQLLVDDSTNPIHFSQMFYLIPDGQSFYVQNDVFRLNYG